MMKEKTVLSVICAIFALLLGASCTPQEQPGGAVTIILSSGAPETRASAEVSDGQEIQMNAGVPDLLLLLFNSQGTLVAKYPDPGHAELLDPPVPTGSDLMIRITKTTGNASIPEGTYSIYALANTAGLWSLTNGSSTISEGSFTNSSITSKAQADLLYFSPLFAANSVSKPHLALRNNPNDLLPLSAIGSVSVSAGGNGTAEVQLKRCASQVVVQFDNRYGAELGLENFSVTFKDLNTSTGYLFPHNPDIPAGIVYADLMQSESPVTLLDNTNPANAVKTYSALVFPGTAPEGFYTCDISFDVTSVDGTPLASSRSFSFTDLPVHNNRGQDITSLARNQKLTITVTISQGTMLSFSFDVGEWDGITENVTFD